jgi:hypothetical protein
MRAMQRSLSAFRSGFAALYSECTAFAHLQVRETSSSRSAAAGAATALRAVREGFWSVHVLRRAVARVRHHREGRGKGNSRGPAEECRR